MCALLIAVSPSVWSQEVPPIAPLPEIPQGSTPSAGASPAPPSVEQLAARLQAMEDLNKKLVDQLAKTNREHDAQMRQVLDRVGDLSRRLNDPQPS